MNEDSKKKMEESIQTFFDQMLKTTINIDKNKYTTIEAIKDIPEASEYLHNKEVMHNTTCEQIVNKWILAISHGSCV